MNVTHLDSARIIREQTLDELKFEKAWKAFEAVVEERHAMKKRIEELEQIVASIPKKRK